MDAEPAAQRRRVSSVMRGMTERRQVRFFLTRQAVNLLYTTDHQHPSPREDSSVTGLPTFHSPGRTGLHSGVLERHTRGQRVKSYML